MLILFYSVQKIQDSIDLNQQTRQICVSLVLRGCTEIFRDIHSLIFLANSSCLEISNYSCLIYMNKRGNCMSYACQVSVLIGPIKTTWSTTTSFISCNEECTNRVLGFMIRFWKFLIRLTAGLQPAVPHLLIKLLYSVPDLIISL